MPGGCVFSLFIFFCLDVCLTVSTDAAIPNIHKDTKTNWNPFNILDPKLKRGGVMSSLRAIKKLTKDAKQVRSDGKFMKFEKAGDMVDSLPDILSLQLEDLNFHKETKGQTTMVTGTKGDSHFTLLPFGEDGVAI